MWTNGDSGQTSARRLQQIQRADGVRVEVVEGNRRRQIVRWLCGRVNDHRGPEGFHQSHDSLAIADVQFVMNEAGQRFEQTFLVPSGVALRPEERRPLIVVDAMHRKALLVEEFHHCGTNQTGGTRHQTDVAHFRFRV